MFGLAVAQAAPGEDNGFFVLVGFVVTAILPMAKTDDQIYEYACHEGNCAMTGILRGARAGEKAR